MPRHRKSRPGVLAQRRARGRSPWRRGGLTLGALGRRLYDRIWRDEVFDRAAGLSTTSSSRFFRHCASSPCLLSLVPGLPLMGSLMNYAIRVLPGDAASLVSRTVAEIIAGANCGLLSLGAIAALWGASSGMLSTMTALNIAFVTRDERSWWRRRLVAMALTVGLSMFTLSALALLVLGERIGEAVALRLGFPMASPRRGNSRNRRRWRSAGWRPSTSSITRAGVAAVLALRHARLDLCAPRLVLMSVALRAYVAYFGNYTPTYASIGGVILLMLWLHESGVVLLVGTEIDSEIREAGAPGVATAAPVTEPTVSYRRQGAERTSARPRA